MPAVEAALGRFQAAHTQVLGVSIDSIFCHAGWAASLGGVSFPLLSDFQPKGAMAASVGAYLEGAGITDRATVIIDSSGVVRYSESAGPGGERDIDSLAAACEKIDTQGDAKVSDFGSAPGLSGSPVLYVRNNCGASQSVLLARTNLHLDKALAVKNVSEDQSAAAELDKISGGKQAPCLVVGGSPTLEAADIVAYLLTQTATPLA